MRVLHFSDIHVQARPSRLFDFLNKRALGYANLILRRRRRFGRVEPKVRALAELAERLKVDFVLCTGDYTALGTDGELAAARALVEPLTRAPLGYATVPGNHDLYVADRGAFAAHFGDLTATDLPEHRAPGRAFPWVRLVGDHLAVVGVNSARPNPHPWRSSGRIPKPELDALGRALADRRVASRFVVVATHYAPRLANGQPDAPHHGMRNAEAFLEACRVVERGLLAFGHVHERYHVRLPEHPLPLFGAGSATDARCHGAWVYDVEGPAEAHAYAASYDGDRWSVASTPTWSCPR